MGTQGTGRRRSAGLIIHSAEEQALDQIAKEVSLPLHLPIRIKELELISHLEPYIQTNIVAIHYLLNIFNSVNVKSYSDNFWDVSKYFYEHNAMVHLGFRRAAHNLLLGRFRYWL